MHVCVLLLSQFVILFFITDWFDGLHTFMRYVCHKSWLGGWFLPQKKSYFALHLPKGWWIFGLDLSLHGDVDVYQFKFFADVCQNKVHFLRLLIFFFFKLLSFPYFWFHVGQHALVIASSVQPCMPVIIFIYSKHKKSCCIFFVVLG
jgi:hypothetical protein